MTARRINIARIIPTTQMRRAARYYADANSSDPFAYALMLAHLCNGIEDAHAVIKYWRPRALMARSRHANTEDDRTRIVAQYDRELAA